MLLWGRTQGLSSGAPSNQSAGQRRPLVSVQPSAERRCTADLAVDVDVGVDVDVDIDVHVQPGDDSLDDGEWDMA